MFAVTLPVLVGALAVSIEAGYWMKSKTDVQLYADLAAYAGALELHAGGNEADILKAAEDLAELNGFDEAKGKMDAYPKPKSGNFIGDEDAIEVTITQSGTQFFSGMYQTDAIKYSVRSVAAMVTESGDDVCALALHPSDASTVNIAGNTVADMPGCDIHSNSTSNSSIAIKGNPDVAARCVSSSGGIPATFSDLECDNIVENSDPVIDPYASLPAPDITGKGCENPVTDSFGNIKIEPGLYCNNIEVSNKLEFNSPGTYYFKNANLNIKKHALITGDGITIVLMHNSAINGLNGQAVIQVSAATAPEPYPGFVIYSDPATQPSGSVSSFKGDTGSYFEGLLYYPNQNLSFGGNGTTAANCTMVVANKIFMSGNSSFASSGCEAKFGLDVAQANIQTAIRVIE